MTAASDAITSLYTLPAADFDRRLQIMLTNLRRIFVEELRDAPDTLQLDQDGLLAFLTGGAVASHLQSSQLADITEEQKEDFQLRLDRNLAEAVLVVQRCLAIIPDSASAAFQREIAAELGVPWV